MVAGLIALPFGGSEGHASEPGSPRLGAGNPVVLILLDELPTASLMTADGQRIKRNRFPRIAEFADGATWYRDNVAGGDFTGWAVPSILTGSLSNRLKIPTAQVFPDNLFTLFGPGRTVHSLETVTELCPVAICPDGHQGEAPDAKFANEFVKAKFYRLDPAQINGWITGIPSGENTLSFMHLELPHLPLRYLPDGRVYPGRSLLMPNDLSVKHWTAGPAAISFIQQRHLLQAGYADLLVGRILDKIRQNGDFENAMIVLTADHGISYDPGDLRRDATATNPGATVNPPLIIKYPGQTRGVVSTASTQSIDILPTIADTLGAEIPPTEGRPVRQARPDRVMTVSKDLMSQITFTTEQMREDRRQVLATQYQRFGKLDLWRLGPRSKLFGRHPGRVPWQLGVKVKFEAPAALRKADHSRARVPALVGGWVKGMDPGKVIALSWNGRIVATTRTFLHLGKVRFGAMVPPSVMVRGKNRIKVFAVGPANGLYRIR
ncbi:MAG: hypothetical protein BGO23_08400 [Solirubrobacterales bacterium 67-14]|nr:MAG: hypothetical protein BGO23_08400 [Solirubrobacterales bacterium 67-14]